MLRLTWLLVFGSLFLVPGRADAYQIKSTEVSARQRCVCSTSYRSARNVHYRGLRRTAYAIGYDPLPYRFGSTWVWEPPYRYYWR
jgi:hypothetical protein